MKKKIKIDSLINKITKLKAFKQGDKDCAINIIKENSDKLVDDPRKIGVKARSGALTASYVTWILGVLTMITPALPISVLLILVSIILDIIGHNRNAKFVKELRRIREMIVNADKSNMSAEEKKACDSVLRKINETVN